jgi:hypothetical protein
VHFDHHDVARPERDIVLPEQFFRAIGIAHHQARDGGVGRFRNAHGDDVIIMSVE